MLCKGAQEAPGFLVTPLLPFMKHFVEEAPNRHERRWHRLAAN